MFWGRCWPEALTKMIDIDVAGRAAQLVAADIASELLNGGADREVGLSADGTIQREATEQIEVELHPLAELKERALRGEIEDGPSALALLLAADRWPPTR